MALIRNLFSINISELDTKQDEFVQAELIATEVELAALIKKHGDEVATPAAIKPFQHFLANRWERICGTDLIYPHAPTLPANLLCIQVARSILCVFAQPDEFGVNSLLMPSVAKSHYFNNFANATLDELPLDRFILTDDNQAFISIESTLHQAIKQRSIVFYTEGSGAKSLPNGTRELSPSEFKRFLSHSKPIKKLYYVLSQLDAKKSHEEKSIGATLNNFVDRFFRDANRYGENGESSPNRFQNVADLVVYVNSLTEQDRQVLYNLPAQYEDGTFSAVMRFFGDPTNCIQAARTMLSRFIREPKNSKVLFKRIPIDPLIEAGNDFKRAFEQTLTVEATYGKAAKELLAKKIIPILNEEIFARLFKDKQYDEFLVTLWPTLSAEQRVSLTSILNDDRLQTVLARQSASVQEEDFVAARQKLLSTISSETETKPVTALYLLNQIDRTRAIIPPTKLSWLTELTLRTVLYLQKGLHIGNNQRYPTVAARCSQHSWGKILGGMALIFFGAVLIAASVACAVASAGASAVLSGLTACAGQKILIAGAVMFGVGGMGAILGGSYLIAKNNSNQFFTLPSPKIPAPEASANKKGMQMVLLT
jgi:hypothetical protein